MLVRAKELPARLGPQAHGDLQAAWKHTLTFLTPGTRPAPPLMAAAVPALALNWTSHHHFEQLIPPWEVAKPFQSAWGQPALQDRGKEQAWVPKEMQPKDFWSNTTHLSSCRP